jgi:hypothetical protein
MGIFKLPAITTAQRLNITPAERELIYDTTNGQIYKGNGVTPGGVLLGSGSSSDIFNEVPTGTKNGVNLIFTLSSNYIATKTRLYLNGQRLKIGDDYIESGANQITFVLPPHAQDNIIIDYSI